MTTCHSKPRTKKKLKSVGWYRNKALQLAQLLSKVRECDDYPNGYVKCISCGQMIPVKESEGGHYISRMCRATEIDKDNIHPQCHRCNCFLSGNVVSYRMHLVERIGEERVHRLELMYEASRGNEIALHELDELDQLEVLRKKGIPYYKEKINSMNEELKKRGISKNAD